MTPHPDSTLLPTRESCYRAIACRDHRFDGWIYVAVTSTGIYCRPSCPAQTPKEENCRFFPAAGAAQQAGFRSCRRCHPDAVPGSPLWNARADTVGRAMRLISDGVVDRVGVTGLAAQLGYSERQLNRLLVAEVGASPLALARAQRAHAARLLVESTELPMSEIAYAAGFASIRQFNDTVRAVFGRPPTTLRAHRSRSAGPVISATRLRLRLPVREPFDTASLFGFLSLRSIRGVEVASADDDQLRYARTMTLPRGLGAVAIEWHPGTGLSADLRLTDLRDLSPAVSRIRRIGDLDADPVAIDETLAADPQLAPLVRANPGLRLPGTPAPHELAARAMIGQQISVAGAATCAAKITERYGRRLPAAEQTDPDSLEGEMPTAVFPSAAELAEVNPEELPMPRARGRALVGLMGALAEGRIQLDHGSDRAQVRAQLLAQPGIGPWTADYIVMRALSDTDVLLDTDLIIKRELARRKVTNSSAWSPWRSYATMHLWVGSVSDAGH